MRLFKKKKSLKDLDENELIIKWADELIFNSNHLGEISKESFLLDHLFDKEPLGIKELKTIRDFVVSKIKIINGEITISKELGMYQDAIQKHLLSHRYIILVQKENEFVWVLTDKGWLVKELDGHLNYKEHRKRELNVLLNQNKVNNWLIGGIISSALIGIIMPYVTYKFFQTGNTHYIINKQYNADTIKVKSVTLDTLLLCK